VDETNITFREMSELSRPACASLRNDAVEPEIAQQAANVVFYGNGLFLK
jgi:hypothetical protein